MASENKIQKIFNNGPSYEINSKNEFLILRQSSESKICQSEIQNVKLFRKQILYQGNAVLYINLMIYRIKAKKAEGLGLLGNQANTIKHKRHTPIEAELHF